ncbi:hypothetical protein G7045_10485 [Acidovorax sp. HDW3]|uniref:hypothetical protein n=1 Tax=Acidovorax sp. HDW3 TaxID=2714923 RepID=UPI001408918C|nr:hypothetical protein [Acidovorax sp. HDW3]QIL44656.1 hypothetical protein G7045_10485 [Acidovorax sp. HDW3]
MDKETIARTIAVESAKAAPPVTVMSHAAANGWTLTSTATALTITYVLVQLLYLAWKWRNEAQDRADRKAGPGTNTPEGKA